MPPLYTEIERDIVDKIHSKQLLPEHPIPTELELCSLYGVSRITVRRAVERLVSARMIYRKRGVGTFVCKPTHHAKSLRLTGYMRDVLTFDQQLTTRILKRGTGDVPAGVLEAFGITAGHKLYCISALNYLDSEPYALTNTFFAEALAAIAPKVQMLDGRTSLREIEDHTELRVRSGDQSIEPMIARGQLAKHLGVKAGTAILTTMRRYYADGPAPLEVVQVFYHPERYRIHVELVGSDSFNAKA
jgi:GntR family transcriptional regulator